MPRRRNAPHAQNSRPSRESTQQTNEDRTRPSSLDDHGLVLKAPPLGVTRFNEPAKLPIIAGIGSQAGELQRAAQLVEFGHVASPCWALSTIHSDSIRSLTLNQSDSVRPRARYVA